MLQKDCENDDRTAENNEEQLQYLLRSGYHLLFPKRRREIAERLIAEELKKENIEEEVRLRIEIAIILIDFYKNRSKEALSRIYEIAEKLDRSDHLPIKAEMFPNLSQVLWSVNDREIALKYGMASIKAYEAAPNNKHLLPYCYYSLGTMYYDIGNSEEATKYFLKGIRNIDGESLVDIGLRIGFGRLLIGISSVESKKKQYEHAKQYLERVLRLGLRNDQWAGGSRVLTDLGSIERQQGNFEEARGLLQEGLDIRLNSDDKSPVVTSYIEMALLYEDKKEVTKAIAFFEKGMDIALEINAKPKLRTIYKHLARIYQGRKDFEKALNFYMRYDQIKEEISDHSLQTTLRNLQMRHEIEKTQKEAEVEKLLNIELKSANQELAAQKKIIEDKNRHIIDSINYAKRIQVAMLPQDHGLREAFLDFFMLFQPRDIVSGDFYWLQMDQERVFFAVVDCTGHGVPGAFMSMIANELLRKAVIDRGYTDPGEILSILHQMIRRTLKQEKTFNQDGMDMSICVFDKSTQELSYAGARNPLVYWDGNELQEIKGTKASIGGNSKTDSLTFNTSTIKPTNHSRFFLFSDGFQDQFGGVDKRKYTKRQLKKDLENTMHLNCEQQQQYLEEKLNTWMLEGKENQIDDILVAGVEFRVE